MTDHTAKMIGAAIALALLALVWLCVRWFDR